MYYLEFYAEAEAEVLCSYMVELYTTQQTESCITKKMALRTHQKAGMQSVVAPG